MLAIKSPWEEFDSTMNTMLKLALLKINTWSAVNAFIVKTAFENPGASQIQLAEFIHMDQSNISRGLNRAGYDELLELISHYQKKITELC